MSECWFIFQNEQLLLTEENGVFQLPTEEALSHLKSRFTRQHRLGPFNKKECYCAEIEASLPLPDHIEPVSLRKALDVLGMDWYVISAKAYSIIAWDNNHHFCGRCGELTLHQPARFERQCPSCHLLLYPRISPSMIVMIQKDDKILMSRSPHFPKGAYGLIAGFVEPGESIEDTVHRETMEEVGITIKNLRYFGSQAWPFPDSFMIGFTADYGSGEITIDPNEIEAAGWYRYDALPGYPTSHISIAQKMIDHYVKEHTHVTHGKFK